VPEKDAFVKLIINQVPPFLGAWMLIGIAAASMSTADGAILAMGTVWANNIVRQLEPWFPRIANDDNLLLSARISTFPFTLAATLIGAYYKRGAGYLLIVRVCVSATSVYSLFHTLFCVMVL
jgi:Na+/proline symporter